MNDPLPDTDDQDIFLLHLQQRANQLVRLVLRQVDSEVPKAMAGLLKLVSDRPMRVTELAKQEGLAQPTVTALVNQAEKRGWVERTCDPTDGRVVLVRITEDGRLARKRLHYEIMTLLRECTRGLRQSEVRALEAASDALLPLIEALQSTPGRS